jgi:hypothetical protein
MADVPDPAALTGAAAQPAGRPVSVRARPDGPEAFTFEPSYRRLDADVGGWLRRLQEAVPEIARLDVDVPGGCALPPAAPFPAGAFRAFVDAARSSLADVPGGRGRMTLSVTSPDAGTATVHVRTEEDDGIYPPLDAAASALAAEVGKWAPCGYSLRIDLEIPAADPAPPGPGGPRP